MFKIVVSLTLLCLVCAEPPVSPVPPKNDSPKQFRYVDEEDPHRPQESYSPTHSAQRQDINQKKYVEPSDHGQSDYHRESDHHHNQGQSQNNQYGVNDNKEYDERRPLVSVSRDDNLLGRNVGVGVNLGFVLLIFNSKQKL